MVIETKKIVKYLDKLLKISEIEDISVNGLQCEGEKKVSKIGLAVDGCIKTYEKAIKKECEMIIVHHGFIWGGLKHLTGPLYKHIKYLIDNKLNVYASHLPLDLHPVLGNNIEIARILGLKDIRPFGRYKQNLIGFEGELKKPLNRGDLIAYIQDKLGGNPILLPFGKLKNKKIGIISGGGSFVLSEAIVKDIDCLITGEGRHENHHMALEGEINVVYVGHYLSEEFGIKSLGRHLENQFGIKTIYIDEPTLF